MLPKHRARPSMGRRAPRLRAAPSVERRKESRLARTVRTLALAALLGAALFAAPHAPASSHAPVSEPLRLLGANPTQGLTTFAIRLDRAMRTVDLSLFDLQGRRLRTLLQGPLAAGEHRVPFARRGLPAGSYMVRLATENGVCTKLLVVLP